VEKKREEEIEELRNKKRDYRYMEADK